MANKKGKAKKRGTSTELDLEAIYRENDIPTPNLEELAIHGFRNDSPPSVSLRYFDDAYQCLSDWQPNELKNLTGFINTLRDTDWSTVESNHSSLRRKKHKNSDSIFKHSTKTEEKLGADITFFELRVSGKARVHGFRKKSTFFLVLLDRNHDIYPM